MTSTQTTEPTTTVSIPGILAELITARVEGYLATYTPRPEVTLAELLRDALKAGKVIRRGNGYSLRIAVTSAAAKSLRIECETVASKRERGQFSYAPEMRKAAVAASERARAALLRLIAAAEASVEVASEAVALPGQPAGVEAGEAGEKSSTPAQRPASDRLPARTEAELAGRPVTGADLLGSVFADGIPLERDVVDVERLVKRAARYHASVVMETGGLKAGADLAEHCTTELAVELRSVTHTGTRAAWLSVAEWLVMAASRRRTGSSSLPRVFAEDQVAPLEIGRLMNITATASSALTGWLVGKDLDRLRAADAAARELAEELHTVTGTGRLTVWLQVARFEIECEAEWLLTPEERAALTA